MSETSDPRVLLPLFLDVSGRTVLVVGGGTIAARKALDLVAVHAKVHVVAPQIAPELTAAAAGGSLTLEQRAFEERDLDGVWLVIAATDDAAVQRRIAEECERARVFCVAVDDPSNASAYGGAIVRRGPVTIAISTSGEAPALARLLREVLEQALPDEGYVEAARALREKWKAEKTPMASRFGELVAAFKARS
jgi:siroheme synthase-like protein